MKKLLFLLTILLMSCNEHIDINIPQTKTLTLDTSNPTQDSIRLYEIYNSLQVDSFPVYEYTLTNVDTPKVILSMIILGVENLTLEDLDN